MLPGANPTTPLLGRLHRPPPRPQRLDGASASNLKPEQRGGSPHSPPHLTPPFAMKSGLDPEACARNRALLARLAAMPVSGVKALADAERPPVARINELTHTDFFHGHANAEVYVTRAIGTYKTQAVAAYQAGSKDYGMVVIYAV